MKRAFLPILFLFLIFAVFCPAWADAAPAAVSAAIYDEASQSYGPARDLPTVRVLLNGGTLESEVPAVLWNDRTMVPLRAIAEALGAQVDWDGEGRQAVISHGADTMILPLSSPAAEVNGVSVPLPGGVPAALVSIDGREHTLVPLRFFSETLGCTVGWLQGSATASITAPALPMTNGLAGLDRPKDPGKYLIVLDAGHGGSASGAYYEHTAEKDLDLAISQKLKDTLDALGYRTLMTRSDDRFVSLDSRAAIANRAKADLFISIHCNAASHAPAFQGLYVYYFPGSATGHKLAQAIQTPACGFTGAVDRGIASDNFAVLRETHMPAVLVEAGFMSCSAELTRLKDPAYQENLARGVAQGIIQYLNGG